LRRQAISGSAQFGDPEIERYFHICSLGVEFDLLGKSTPCHIQLQFQLSALFEYNKQNVHLTQQQIGLLQSIEMQIVEKEEAIFVDTVLKIRQANEQFRKLKEEEAAK